MSTLSGPAAVPETGPEAPLQNPESSTLSPSNVLRSDSESPGSSAKDHSRDALKRACGCSNKKGRRLVVCIDGTSNQFGEKNTNVIELYRLIKKEEGDHQLTYYNSGIGTYARPSWKSWAYYKRVFGHKIDLAIAWNFERIVLDAYRWLSETYKDGDCIFLFGFSRGAYQVRTLSAMIDRVGLIHRGNEAQIAFAYQLYADPDSSDSALPQPILPTTSSARRSPTATFKRTFSRRVKVHFIGAWDTVSSIGIVRSRKLLPGTIEGMNHTCFFRHALALDERRVKFLPEYVNGGDGPGPQESTTEVKGRPHTKEVWFAGTHSDVGGGNEENMSLDSSRPSLRWMFSEASAAGLHLEPFEREYSDEEVLDIHESLTWAWKPFEHLPFRRLTYGQPKDNKRLVELNGWICLESLALLLSFLWCIFGALFTCLVWLVLQLSGVRRWTGQAGPFISKALRSCWEALRSPARLWRAEHRPADTSAVASDVDGRWHVIGSEEQASKTTTSWPPHRSEGRVIQDGQKIHPSVWRLKNFGRALDTGEAQTKQYTPHAQLSLHPDITWDSLRRLKDFGEGDGTMNPWKKWKEVDLYDLVDELMELYTGSSSVDSEDDAQRTQLGMMYIRAKSPSGPQELLRALVQRCERRDVEIRYPIFCEVLKVILSTSESRPDVKLLARMLKPAIDGITDWRCQNFVVELTKGLEDVEGLVAQYAPHECVIDNVEQRAQLVAIRIWAVWNRETVISVLLRRLREPITPENPGIRPDVFLNILDILIDSAPSDSEVKVDIPYHLIRSRISHHRHTDGDGRKAFRRVLERCAEVTRTVQVLTGHTSFVRPVAFSPDGNLLVSGSGDKTLRLWNTETGQMVGKPLVGHGNSVVGAAFSPDGNYIVSSSFDIRIWDVQSQDMVGMPFQGHTGAIWSVAYSPNGERIVSGSADCTIRIWDVNTGQLIKAPWRLEGEQNYVVSVAFSPDDKHVVSASADHTVRIWSVATGETMSALKGHTGIVRSVAYSPDGKQIVSGSNDHTIRIWDAETGKTVRRPFEGHSDEVWSVAFSLDGRQIVSGSSDNAARIWDVETGKMVGKPYEGHTGPVPCVTFSSDGRRIASSSADGTARIWDVLEPPLSASSSRRVHEETGVDLMGQGVAEGEEDRESGRRGGQGKRKERRETGGTGRGI